MEPLKLMEPIQCMFENKQKLRKLGFTDQEITVAEGEYGVLQHKAKMDSPTSFPAVIKGSKKDNQKLKEMFSELQEIILKYNGDGREKSEFDRLIQFYEIWQNDSSLKPPTTPPIMRKERKKRDTIRMSMTVRGSGDWWDFSPNKRNRPKLSDVYPPKKIELSEEEYQKLMKDREEREKLAQENKMYRDQVEELTTRLSKVASDKLTRGNPNFADLSDKYRPTKIAERFGLVYDDEWTEALDELKERLNKDEKELYELLLTIVKIGLEFCQEVEKKQLDAVVKGMRDPMLQPVWVSEGKDYSVAEMESDVSFTASNTKFAKDFRKTNAVSSVGPLCTIFKDGKFKDKVEWDLYSMVNTCVYIDKCIECLWLMCVQDPPMYIMWLEPGMPHDPANFNMFATQGEKVEFTVWPAVFLHKNGPLVTKGYVKLC